MKIKAFEKVIAGATHDSNNKIIVNFNKDYTDFLAQNKKTIEIFSIIHADIHGNVLVYYEEIPQPAGKPEQEDRFNNLDV